MSSEIKEEQYTTTKTYLKPCLNISIYIRTRDPFVMSVPSDDKDRLAFQEMYDDWKETFLDEIGYEIIDYCRQYNPLLLSNRALHHWVDYIWEFIDYNADHMKIQGDDADELTETEEFNR